MDRITLKQLDGFVASLNKKYGLPLTRYTRKDRTPIGNIGNLYVEDGSVGYSLLQIYNKGGGTVVIIPPCTKRELYMRLQAIDQFNHFVLDK